MKSISSNLEELLASGVPHTTFLRNSDSMALSEFRGVTVDTHLFLYQLVKGL